jgi:hypothetical protein
MTYIVLRILFFAVHERHYDAESRRGHGSVSGDCGVTVV